MTEAIYSIENPTTREMFALAKECLYNAKGAERYKLYWSAQQFFIQSRTTRDLALMMALVEGAMKSCNRSTDGVKGGGQNGQENIKTLGTRPKFSVIQGDANKTYTVA